METNCLTQDWIDKLIKLATISSEEDSMYSIHSSLTSDIDSCFEYCKKVTAFHSKSFYMASRLLPVEKRKAIQTLYAFCRTTDDIVDMATNYELANHIERWRNDTTSHLIRYNDPVVIAWAYTRKQFKIPNLYADQLIDGVKTDLVKKRYKNFQELSTYCYGVASTVGLMSMHIVGYHSEKALPYAIKLGVALQLTNILRDIEEDWNRGRIYLPSDEMTEFGITEEYFKEKRVDDRWKAFMKFQIERCRNLYEEAWPGIQLLHKDGRLAIAAASSFYKKILSEIEANNYDVFSHRASVSKWGKLKQIPDLLIKYKYAGSLNSILS